MEYILSIKQVYLDLIKQDKKIHEYRLANEERRKIRIGDLLILQSEKESLKVEVTNIKIVSSWYKALLNNYKKDFDGVYSSLEETMEACNKFYHEDDVKKYGIIIYTIKRK